MNYWQSHFRKKVLALVMTGCFIFSGFAFGFGETKPQGIEIKEFSLLDTASDIVGSDYFEPEGYKDGHFKLKLSLEQKTVINAVVLRTTDAYGKDNAHGIWRTNRVTAGWLLGIVQEKTVKTATGETTDRVIINPGFRKDVKEPVGEFEGDLTFDLYASNNGHNGSINESQYFVLEIETPQGTVSSEPIKYKEPMTAKDPSPPSSSKPDPAPSSKPVPTPSSSPSTPPAAEAQKIHVFFKGKELQFDGTQPIIKNGTTLVPFRKLFETLGFKVDWIETKTYRQAIGTKSGLTIKLTIDSKTAKVNDKDVALSVPAQIISGKTMVPLRFISENSGYQVSYSRTGNITTIEINNPGTGTDQEPSAPEPTTPDLTVEPYVVKGYLLDAEGNPIAGASVYADNTLQYDSNILGTTDDSGYYRLELPPIATTWRMGAHFSKTIEGKTFTYDIYADGDQPFAGNSGAIRNFTWVNGDGYIFVYPDFYSFGDDLPEFDINDVEITLTPIQNGKAGKPITKRVGQVNDGNGIDQLPIARYKATVRWLPEGHDPIPMLVRLNNKGEYAESVEFTFGDSVSGANTLDFKQELEISAP